jgi:anti-sigma-K factor RskA
MDLRQIEELLPFYALDALTDDEKSQVEAYLREHPEMREQIKEMQSASSALPYSVPPMEPSSRVKESLMARVAAEAKGRSMISEPKQASRPREMQNIFQFLSFGFAVVAVVWAVVLNIQLNQMRSEVSTLKGALVSQSTALEKINQSIEQINTKLPEANPSSAVTISLKGTSVQPKAQGELIANPNNQTAVLVITGLPKLEAGKTYQVWLIDAAGPKSAGLLSVDTGGQGVVVVSSNTTIGSFQVLAISVEPAGGSVQPTGDIVMSGNL